MGNRLTWSRLKRSIADLFHTGGWRWVEPPELQNGIAVDRLVSPLRYDILPRLEFFCFYLQNRDRLRDSAELVEAARNTNYFTWFVSSDAVRRIGAPALQDKETLEKRFAARVHRSAALFESFLNRGYRPNPPIILKTADRVLPASARRGCYTGKKVSERYFLSDGCHRLALLMSRGVKTLPRGYFNVRSYPEFSPFDSTSLLVRSLAVRESEYFEFLSRRYAAPRVFLDRDTLLNHVHQHCPARMGELMDVLRIDGYLDGNGQKGSGHEKG